MPFHRGTRYPLLGSPTTYMAKVLGLGPIAYWPLNETTGTTAYCLVNSAQNGTYTGVTLGATTAPDGSPAPYWDGANDYLNIYSTTLRNAFNGAEGTALLWFKINAASGWTDGGYRHIMTLYVNANNMVYLYRTTTANSVNFRYKAGGTQEEIHTEGQTSTDWIHYGITWSKTADQVKTYIGGLNISTYITLGTWAGSLSSTQTLLGAYTQAPLYVHHGYLSHFAIFNSALSAPDMSSLANV